MIDCFEYNGTVLYQDFKSGGLLDPSFQNLGVQVKVWGVKLITIGRENTQKSHSSQLQILSI